eukprot:7640849-Heterocapsa_arctica.AAC.1
MVARMIGRTQFWHSSRQQKVASLTGSPRPGSEGLAHGRAPSNPRGSKLMSPPLGPGDRRHQNSSVVDSHATAAHSAQGMGPVAPEALAPDRPAGGTSSSGPA